MAKKKSSDETSSSSDADKASPQQTDSDKHSPQQTDSDQPSPPQTDSDQPSPPQTDSDKSSPDSEKSRPDSDKHSSSHKVIKESDSPKSAPSDSPPPSPPPSPPSPAKTPPPAEFNSPPPTPSKSPPPSPDPSPPPPSPSPPLQSSPPPSTPPPQKSSSPPPSPSTPPPSPPPTVVESPPPPQHSPPSQTHAPPPPSHSPPTPTPPSPASDVTLSPPPLAPSISGTTPRTSTASSSPHSKPSSTSPKGDSSSSSPPKSGDGNHVGEYVGFGLAGAFAIAIIALVLYFILTRKRKQGHVYAMPPPKRSHMKGGGDVHYYVEEPGFGSGPQDGYYNASQDQGGGMPHIRSPSDPAQHVSTGQIFFTYEKIVEITNNFSRENVIGEGGFGYVYKATMPDGRIGAAKILKAGSGQGEREFRAEVDIISRVHHRHLVSLIGFCIAEQQRVLIYEFVPNGNLNQHLHGNGRPILDWSMRTKIALGSARGISYLHEGCNPKIIHRDIKSANILLDNAYEAQVADFGLARLTDDANTHVSTRVMGTFGYMAPEYATSGKLTDRSDVFSFGVVLLELITGRKPVDTTQPIGDESLVEWARPLLLHAVETGDFGELVDPRLENQYVDSEMFKMIEAAAACVRHSAPKRPSMVQVARALENGDQGNDLSNGVKYGQSTIYDSGQYNADIMRFRRMANGSFDDSEFGMYSSGYGSRDMSASKPSTTPFSEGADSEVRAFYNQRENMT